MKFDELDARMRVFEAAHDYSVLPGIFIVQRSTELTAAIEALILVWTASDAEEYVNSLRTLPL